ncbi:MAG: 16S rRNA (uracil(1498)-N(3))-methyltransferase [Kangiellaceae bacterium]|nr:16S rRNA (uracil(1498)-N(3))-methyltransferase [Kangiellaceae bacterium]
MRSHRFFTDLALLEDTLFYLPAEAAHHCSQVLRYKVGDLLTVFNGDGFNYPATIVSIERKRCQIKTTKKLFSENESPLSIHLFQGIARGDKMDLIIQKAVELGVYEITPIFTERCNVKLDPKRLEKKILHWKKTIISACEQSGRAKVPQLNPAIQLDQLTSVEQPTIYLEPKATQSIDSLDIEKTIGIIIGPEGGFSDKDLAHAEMLKLIGVQFGPRILRTETAGLAAIAILQNRFGDF